MTDAELTMTVYSGWHLERGMADLAAEYVAAKWHRPITVMPVDAGLAGTLWACYDRSEAPPR